MQARFKSVAENKRLPSETLHIVTLTQEVSLIFSSRLDESLFDFQ